MFLDLLVKRLWPDLLGDGLDIFFVEESVVGRGEFAVGRFGGVFGDFGGGEPSVHGPNMGSGRTLV